MLDALLRLSISLWAAGAGLAGPAYYSQEGRPIPVIVQGEGDDTVLFLGGQHGDEPQGRDLVNRLLRELARRPGLLAGHRLVAMPAVNPDGLVRHSRPNARGVDINRNFPTRDWHLSTTDRYFSGPEPGSERETRAIQDVVARYQPVRIVNIHSPLALVNYEGNAPAPALARVMAGLCGCPAVDDIGYPTPGSFGTYYGKEQGIPVITLETSADTGPERLWKHYGPALLAAIDFPPAARR